jgi:hypothetical protein
MEECSTTRRIGAEEGAVERGARSASPTSGKLEQERTCTSDTRLFETHVPTLGEDIKREDVLKEAMPAYDQAVASEQQRPEQKADEEKAQADALKAPAEAQQQQATRAETATAG